MPAWHLILAFDLDRPTEAQLAELVTDEVPESLALEYKASPALARADDKVGEARKDVSALANSDGGRIIYSVVARDGVPVALDDGVDGTTVSERSAAIQPQIKKHRFHGDWNYTIRSAPRRSLPISYFVPGP